jgi:O-antigen/teichoic acid export membrane protein
MLRAFGKDLAIYGAGDFVLKFLAFAVFPIYAFVFSVEEFGVLALVSVSAGLVSLCVNVGLNNAVQRFYWDPATPEAHRPQLVSSGLLVLVVWSVLLVGVLLLLLYPFRTAISARYEVAWPILVLALLTVIPTQILQYALDVLRLHFSPWKFMWVSFLRNLLGILLGLVLILGFHQGLVGYFWGAFWGAVIATPMALLLIRRDLVPAFHSGTARQLVGFGYPFIFAGLAYWVFGSMDRWMLAELSDTTNVGWYSIAFKFATVVVFLNAAFGQAWSPMAIKLLSDDPDYRQTYSRIFSLWFFALAVIGSGVALFAPELLMLTTPQEFWPAAMVFGVVVMGTVLSGTTQLTALGISLARRTQLLSMAAWVTAGVNLLLNWLLIPIYGALGAGIATFVSYAVLTGLYLFWSQQLHPIPLERAKLLYSLAVVVLVIPVSLYLGEQRWHAGLVIAKLSLASVIVAGGLFLRIVDVTHFTGILRWRALPTRGV